MRRERRKFGRKRIPRKVLRRCGKNALIGERQICAEVKARIPRMEAAQRRREFPEFVKLRRALQNHKGSSLLQYNREQGLFSPVESKTRESLGRKAELCRKEAERRNSGVEHRLRQCFPRGKSFRKLTGQRKETRVPAGQDRNPLCLCLFRKRGNFGRPVTIRAVRRRPSGRPKQCQRKLLHAACAD